MTPGATTDVQPIVVPSPAVLSGHNHGSLRTSQPPQPPGDIPTPSATPAVVSPHDVTLWCHPMSPLTVMGTLSWLAGMLRASLAVPSRWVDTWPWKPSAWTVTRGAGDWSGLVT